LIGATIQLVIFRVDARRPRHVRFWYSAFNLL